MSLNILVAGGSGFIGTRLVNRLKKAGNDVTIFDLVPPPENDVPYIQGDICDLDAISNAASGHDVIYNLAAQHRDDVRPVELYEQVNVFGSRNICTAAERANVKRIVFTSSVAVYGTCAYALSESEPHNWINEYGRTKSLAENEYTAWKARAAENRLVIVRPTVVFGPGNRGNVYNLLKQISSGRFLMVGNGKNQKSMAFVGNMADFLIHVLTLEGSSHIFNYADKPDFDMNTLVRLVREHFGHKSGTGPRLPGGVALLAGYVADGVARVTGRNLPISSVRVQKFQANTIIDARQAFASGFKPMTTLEDGLLQTMAFDFKR